MRHMARGTERDRLRPKKSQIRKLEVRKNQKKKNPGENKWGAEKEECAKPREKKKSSGKPQKNGSMAQGPGPKRPGEAGGGGRKSRGGGKTSDLKKIGVASVPEAQCHNEEDSFCRRERNWTGERRKWREHGGAS